MLTKKQRTMENENKENTREEACTLCGQLYHNFTFKGGYICESCLHSIKEQEEPYCCNKEE